MMYKIREEDEKHYLKEGQVDFKKKSQNSSDLLMNANLLGSLISRDSREEPKKLTMGKFVLRRSLFSKKMVLNEGQ